MKTANDKYLIWLISLVVDRVIKLQGDHDRPKIALMMDIEGCHCNGCPLRLHEMLTCSPGDLLHDVNGIIMHIHRHTGKLDGIFQPRMAL